MRVVLQRYIASAQSVSDSNGHPISSSPGQGRTSVEFAGEAAKGRGKPSKTQSCQ